MKTGGIDLGGTKIEARLFNEDWQVLESRRVPTPQTSYKDLLNELTTQVRWLRSFDQAGEIPVGIGMPGLIDARTGNVLTANLCASGNPIQHDLQKAAGSGILVIKDCRAFTLSEARLGAGRGYVSVVGLIIGTGLAGGHSLNGDLVPVYNGQGGEFGHIPLPAALVERHGLPLVTCGCGKLGCLETYAAGPGIERLANHVTGSTKTGAEIFEQSRAGDPEARKVFDIWLDVIAETVCILMMAIDPDCIVLGGGVSKIPGLPDLIAETVSPKLLSGTYLPRIVLAEGGDSSGTRGAALATHLLREASKERHGQGR